VNIDALAIQSLHPAGAGVSEIEAAEASYFSKGL
jgi:hypothetical protein